MNKKSAVWSILVAGLLAIWSCTPPAGSPSGAQIFLTINNDTGCNVVATLDGGNPVTETASGGPYTLYTGVTIGSHTVRIQGPSNSSSCNFNITGGNQTVTVTNPCMAVSGTTGYIQSCS